MKYDPDTYCRDCKRSIYGEYANCDINIENDGKYVKGEHPCYCKIGLDEKDGRKVSVREKNKWIKKKYWISSTAVSGR